MAQHEIETQWMGKMQFNALVNGHTIIMDAPERVGGEDNGPIPKPFVLTALSGELSKQQPIEYVSIHVIYEMKGNEIFKDAAMNAVATSQEKYCGVSSMLKKALPVTWEVNFNGVPVFNNHKTPINLQTIA